MKSVLLFKTLVDSESVNTWATSIENGLPEGFAVTATSTSFMAFELLSQRTFDLLLIDGAAHGALDVARKVSSLNKKITIVYLGSPGKKSETTELVSAFEAGCDDYLASPMEAIEIRLRLQARFKDRYASPSNDYVWKGALRMAVPQQRVVQTSSDGERDLELTPNEFRILYALANRERQTLSRDEILREAWGEGLHVEARTVDKHVCSLRRKLGSYARSLVSVAGKGYLFDSRLVQGPVVTIPNPYIESMAEL